MSITIGTRIGPYEVTSPLGAGGMGVVYRARDTKLQRDVALKLLPDHLSNDSDRLSRFQREAQVLASLNHPNIAQIYGLEQVNGAGCIVMELVEGETLADRLKRGAIPVDETLQIARQIVEALEAAHERGIVHRDLKPANIKLSPAGKAKVLDFGLAKALGAPRFESDLANSPTAMSESTPGVIMGTAGYMSPEQARGKEVDARTDIWAFGVIVYEMLTGRRAYDGETTTDIFAKIVAGQPDWNMLPRETPPSIRMLLTAALNKEAPKRLQAVGDARLFLDPALAPDAPHPDVPARLTKRYAWLTAALATALVVALIPAAFYFLRSPALPSEIRFEMPAPGIVPDSLSISPDGQRVAYIAPTGGKPAIWVRPTGSATAQPLPGTENVFDVPFWSPDSQQLGFFADGKLKTIDAAGGSARVLADAAIVGTGDWKNDGILYTSLVVGRPAIVRIPASGGKPVPVTTLNQDAAHIVPLFLPDGRHFLYHALNGQEVTVYVKALDSNSPKRLLDYRLEPGSSISLRYMAPGYLMFTRNYALMAQPFDADRLELTAEPILLVEDVRGFDASESGTLIYRKRGASQPGVSSPLLLTDRAGKPVARIPSPSTPRDLALSRDGRRAALTSWGTGAADIWVIDLARSVPSPVTTGPAIDVVPVWSPDGSRIVFVHSDASKKLPPTLYQKSSNGVDAEEPLLPIDPGSVDIAMDWSRDGQHLLFGRFAAPSGPGDLWVLPLFGDRKPDRFIPESPFIEAQAQFSPDGRYIAYATNQSGAFQIVVQPFPDSSKGRWPITANGGIQPRWNSNGRELFYLTLDGKLMAVSVKLDPVFEPSQPKELFQTSIRVSIDPLEFHYDVMPDGHRFLMIAPNSGESDTSSTPITAVVNWTAMLAKKR